MEAFSDKGQAERAASAARRRAPGQLSVEQAINRYMQHLEDKGNKPSSLDRTRRRLTEFHDLELPVVDVTPAKVAAWYQARAAKLAVDSHRNELNEAKTFWRWCVHSGFVGKSPAEGVEPHGRRNRGKPQLRMMEARKLFVVTSELAAKGDEGALAVLSVLTMGMRVQELLARKVRDVDIGDQVLLWIDEGKTASARRFHEVPDPVADLLVEKVRGRDAGEWLFPAQTSTGRRRREWLTHACRRLTTLAEVPYVSPQGLRGTWATLTSEAGVASHVVARELGHADDGVTKRHYIAPGALDRSRTRKMLRVVEGGLR